MRQLSLNFIVPFFVFVYIVNGDKLTFMVEDGATECFFYDAAEGQTVKIVFEVLRGGALDIGLNIHNGEGDRVYSGTIYEGSEQKFTAGISSTYSFCWENTGSRGGGSDKIITMTVYVDDERHTQTVKPLTKEHLDPVAEALNRIDQELLLVEKDQRYIRIREQRHRDTAENTNHRVMMFSLVEAFVMLAMIGGQVYTLKMFFSKNKRTI
eukprot:TRINITY_DN13119_c0_g1_i1.p1 TRINITY_DN13119_c0_g1~~TRINITY_DN13119_c0_g1_i1.p1  ORF type:complete len:210 (+),score=10.54 TRINITY_DN13119_c0_g1_i1:49-678(+)